MREFIDLIEWDTDDELPLPERKWEDIGWDMDDDLPPPERDWEDITNWNSVPQNTKDFLKREFPKVEDLTDSLTDNNGYILDVSYLNPTCMHFILNDDYHWLFEELERQWEIHENLMELIGMTLCIQQSGVGTSILWNTFKLCRKLKVKRMILEAAKTGAYVWAKAGFIPYQDDWKKLWTTLRSELNQIADGISNTLDIQNLENLINSDDPKSIWKIADYEDSNGRKLGKEILINNSSWRGFIDVNDNEQATRLNEYCNKPRTH